MPPRRAAAAQAKRRFAEAESDSDPSEGAQSDSGESSGSHSAYTEDGEDAAEDDEELEASPGSDEEDEEETPPAAKRKRGAAGGGGGRKSAGGRSTSSQTATPVKRLKAATGPVGSNGKARSGVTKRKQDSDDEEEEDSSSVDGEGILQVTKLAPAPSQRHREWLSILAVETALRMEDVEGSAAHCVIWTCIARSQKLERSDSLSLTSWRTWQTPSTMIESGSTHMRRSGNG